MKSMIRHIQCALGMHWWHYQRSVVVRQKFNANSDILSPPKLDTEYVCCCCGCTHWVR